jgi:pimeloyl-ACP methyl ester carboxylesterase
LGLLVVEPRSVIEDHEQVNLNRTTLLVLLTALLSCGARAATEAEQCNAPSGTQPFEFVDGENVLRGFIDFPKRSGPHAAVLIIHGSGKTDVFHGGGFYYGSYEQLRNTFRDAGLATVVWDKPGNGCSTGSYAPGIPLRQRAHEATLALRALKLRSDIDPARMGLWALSQGGWVAPMAAVQTNDVNFLVLVSGPGRDVPGLTEYQALARLKAQGIGDMELETAAAHMRRALAIMRAGGPIESYVKAVEPLQRYPVLREFGITEGTPEDYRFWQNVVDFQYRPDTALRELRQPVLAIFGDRDDVVNWRESIHVYREAFRSGGNGDVTIKVFRDADHELMHVGSTQPVGGYLETMKKWLSKQTRD